MHIKFIARGTGSAKSAETYLLQDHDHKGEIRPSVEVLYGNPAQVTELIDSLDFKHKYRSAVIAWAKDDHPTPEQKREVLDDFIRISHAGLDPDRWAMYAVDHGDHIHVISAQVELRTRKSFNIAPPGWQKTFDILRDKYNVKYQWARPDDITRSRVINHKTHVHLSTTHSKARKELNGLVAERVSDGSVTTAKEVENYLNSLEGVTVKPRRGNKALSVEVEGVKKPIRLEGLAYGREFNARELVKELEAEKRARTQETGADREREVARLERELEGVYESRATENRKRYDRPTQELARQNDRSPSKDRSRRESHSQHVEGEQSRDRGRSLDPVRDVEQSESPLLDNTPHSGLDSHDRTRVRTMGLGGGHIRPQPNPPSPERRDHPSPTEQRPRQQVASNSQDVQQRGRAKEKARSVATGQRELGSTVRADQGVDYDAVRKRVEERVRASKRTIQQGIRERHEAIRNQLAEDRERISADHQRSEDHHRSAEPNIGTLQQRNAEYADQHRRGTATSLKEQSHEVDVKAGRFGEARRELGRAVERFISRATDKVREIARKVRQHTQSRGWGMSR